METEKIKSGKDRSNLTQYVLTGLLILAAFYIGMLFTKVQDLEKAPVAEGTVDQPKTAQQPQQQAAPTSAITMDILKSFINEKKQISFGDANKKVIFLEVSDPSCPFCHIAAGKNLELLETAQGGRFKIASQGGTYVPPVVEMKKLVDQGKASYIWIYKNGHGNGELGAQALYCAKDQNKFWEAHDLLMSADGYEILNTTVKNDVSKAGQMAEFLKSAVNVKQMTDCLTSKKYAAQVQADDQLMGGTYGINGTPNFHVNTTEFSGAQPFTSMQSVVDAAL